MPRSSEPIRDTSTRAESGLELLVAGGGRMGVATADHLVGKRRDVTFVDQSPDKPPCTADVTTVSQALSDAVAIENLHETIGPVDAVLAVGSDSESLYLGHLCDRVFCDAITLATLSDPNRRGAFTDTGVEPLPIPELLAERIVQRVHDHGAVQDAR